MEYFMPADTVSNQLWVGVSFSLASRLEARVEQLRRSTPSFGKVGGLCFKWGRRLGILTTVIPIALAYRRVESKRGEWSDERLSDELARLDDKCAPAIYTLCQRRRGVLIKMAQFLLTSGVLREKWKMTLEPLLSKAEPPQPFADVRRALELELGELDRIFRSIVAAPIGTASIGQVHRATLVSGEEVAVKVRSPEMIEAFDTDLHDLLALVRRFYPEQCALVEGWADVLRYEADMRREAKVRARARRRQRESGGGLACALLSQ